MNADFEDKEKFRKYCYDLQMKELKESRPSYGLKMKIQEEINNILKKIIKNPPIDNNDLYIKQDEIKGLKPCELYNYYKSANGNSEQTIFCRNLSEACDFIKIKTDGYGYKRTNIYVHELECDLNFTKIRYFSGKIKEINNFIKEFFKIDDNNKFLFKHLFIRLENLEKETRNQIRNQNIEIEKLTKQVIELQEQLEKK